MDSYVKKNFDNFESYCDDVFKHYQNGYKIKYYEYVYNTILKLYITVTLYEKTKRKNEYGYFCAKNKTINEIAILINDKSSKGYKIDFIDIKNIDIYNHESRMNVFVIFKKISTNKIYFITYHPYIDGQSIVEKLKIKNNKDEKYDFEFYQLVKCGDPRVDIYYLVTFYSKI